MNEEEKIKAEEQWDEINNKLCELKIELEKYPGSREVSLAKTKLDETILWWQAERGFLQSTVNKASL